VVATDGVDGGNGSQVGEGAPSMTSQLHTIITDIRQGLDGDEKNGGRSSPAAAEVTRVVCGGRQRSWPMIPKPWAKEAHGSEDQLCRRNRPMVEPNGG
jgi:hypothetical protein